MASSSNNQGRGIKTPHSRTRQIEDIMQTGVSHGDRVPARTVAPPVHRFLQFDNPYDTERCRRLRRRSVRPIKSISWDLMKIVDQYDRLTNLLPLHSPWRRFFDILETSYDELVYEFWTTFSYTHHNNFIQFRLGGELQAMTLERFAMYLEIYTEEETRLPIFTEALTSYPGDVRNFWNLISSRVWNNNNQTTDMNDYLHRYMHRVISETIRGRGSNLHRVSFDDLFYLYSIFGSVSINVAHSLASYFDHYRKSRYYPTFLMGGSYITRLAKSLGVINELTIQELTPQNPGFIDYNYILGIPSIIPLQTWSIPSATTRVNPTTGAEQLHNQLMAFPQSSFYRHDLHVQQTLPSITPVALESSPPSIMGYVPYLGQQPQPSLPYVMPDLQNQQQLPLPLPEHHLSDLSNFQQLLQEVSSPIPMEFVGGEPNEEVGVEISTQPQQLLDQPSLNQQWQHQQPTIGVGTSTMPPVEVTLDSLSKQMQSMSEQLQWLIQQNQWIVQSLNHLATKFPVQLSLSPNPSFQPQTYGQSSQTPGQYQPQSQTGPGPSNTGQFSPSNDLNVDDYF